METWSTLLLIQFSSVQFSRVQFFVPHESQHARPPCPSTNSWSSSKFMCIESVIPSSHLILYCPLLLPSSMFPASGSFQMSEFFRPGGQSTGVSALASFLPKKSQGWSPSEWTGWISLESKGLSSLLQHHSINSSVLSFLHSPTLTSIHDHWKTHSLD